MATPSTHHRSTLTPEVETLLGTVRRRIRQYVWLQGGAAAAAWLGFAFWGTLLADWFFEPTSLLRALVLVAVLAVFAGIVVRQIARRAFVPITQSNVATVLERRFPELNDSLLTAVVLGGRSPDDSEVDRRMLDCTLREAASRIEAVRVHQVFNWRPLWLHCSAATLLTSSVLLFALLFPDAFGVWTRRALGLSNELWPRSTRLSVAGFTNGIHKVARGSDLEIAVRADAAMPRVPQSVQVRYEIDGGGRGRATMDRRGMVEIDAKTFQEYTYTFRSVLANIRFDIHGGDDAVRGLRILAVDSPTISRMTLHCDLPSYMGRKQPPLPVTGVMQVPQGTRVVVEAGEANKDLVRVQIHGLVGDRPLPQVLLEQSQLTADHRGFSHAIPSVQKDTTLLFTLTDTDGITGREPVRLALVPTPDEPPHMQVALDGIGTAITTRARVPMTGRIIDDYGVRRVWFEYDVDSQKPSRRAIAELQEAPASYSLAGACFEAGDLTLKPGQKLLLSVNAADLRDLGDGPNIASSERWLLDVVTPEQLRAMLEARELVLRQRFERLIQEMTETRDNLARLALDSGRVEPVRGGQPASSPTPAASEPSEDAAESSAQQHSLRLLRVESAQINCRKGASEILGVAESFEDIRKQLINNRIDTEEWKERLQNGIAQPLHHIATNMFSELGRRLEGLLLGLQSGRQEPALRDLAQQQAEEILVAMRKVLDRMMEMEDFNAVVELLQNIIEAQQKVHEGTQQRHKDRIRELLDDAKKKNAAAPADAIAKEQQGIGEKYKHFEDVLLRMVELSELNDPRKAALLRKAVAQSKDALIAVRLERLAEMLNKHQFSKALENQKELDRDLQSLLELLVSENRAKRLENEKARIREYLKRLNAIIKQQKDLQSRTGGGDDANRLADQQEKVAQKAGGLARDLQKQEENDAAKAPEKDGAENAKEGSKQEREERKEQGKDAPPKEQDQGPREEGQAEPNDSNGKGQGESPTDPSARKRLEAAQQRMKEAEAKLKEAERRGAVEKQEQAIRELEQAKAELEEILRQLREEEIERTLAVLEARFRKMLQMQEAVYEGTVRLDGVPASDRTRSHEIEASRLSGRESQIVVEVDKAAMLLREDGSAVAFPEAIAQMRDDMAQIVARLAKANTGKITQNIEEDVLAALKEMIDSLQKAKKSLENKGAPAPKSSPENGQPGDPPLVDALAELKMIRALQMRVNTRTVRYSQMIEGEQAENVELVDALKQLAEREQRIHRITRDLEMGKNQ